MSPALQADSLLSEPPGKRWKREGEHLAVSLHLVSFLGVACVLPSCFRCCGEERLELCHVTHSLPRGQARIGGL